MIQAQIKVSYAGFDLDADLQLPKSGITAIYGPSGSGKTTLLRCLAGLERTSSSMISIDGEVWQSQDTFVPTHMRAIGYVFQESSLFGHLSVQGNLDYAKKRARKNSESISDKNIIDLLGIGHLLTRNPSGLSGGERQRVAIARALLSSPKLLLMDEPLASLDKDRKKEIIPYLKELRSALDIPVIYVSHAREEITQIADHLLFLQQGKVIASGPLQDIMSRIDLPLSRAEDAGAVIEVSVIAKENEWKMERVSFSGGELWLRDSGLPAGSVHRVQILARDVSLARTKHQDTSIQNILPVIITDISEDARAGSALVQVKAGTDMLLARVTLRSLKRLALQKGDNVWAQIKSVALIQ